MNRLAAVLGACAFASGFGIRIVDPMVPLLSSEFGVSLGATSLLVTAFALTYALGQPVLGPLGDGIGKTRLILLCGGIVSVLLLLCALSPDFVPLAVARGISGFAAGGIIPLAIAALSDSVEASERQVALGRFLVASILGQMLGATASGVVSELFGWRAVFVLTALLMSTATAVAFLSLPPERRLPPQTRRLSLLQRMERSCRAVGPSACSASFFSGRLPHTEPSRSSPPSWQSASEPGPMRQALSWAGSAWAASFTLSPYGT